jgi:phenylacetate-CoA ligase
MIYNEEFETLPREVLETLQLKRLKQVVQRVYHTVGHYRRSFDEAGVQPDDIHTLDDLKRFPFTTKQDLRDNYPFGMFAVHRRGLHEARYRHLVGADGPLFRRCGSHEK